MDALALRPTRCAGRGSPRRARRRRARAGDAIVVLRRAARPHRRARRADRQTVFTDAWELRFSPLPAWTQLTARHQLRRRRATGCSACSMPAGGRIVTVGGVDPGTGVSSTRRVGVPAERPSTTGHAGGLGRSAPTRSRDRLRGVRCREAARARSTAAAGRRAPTDVRLEPDLGARPRLPARMVPPRARVRGAGAALRAGDRVRSGRGRALDVRRARGARRRGRKHRPSCGARRSRRNPPGCAWRSWDRGRMRARRRPARSIPCRGGRSCFGGLWRKLRDATTTTRGASAPDRRSHGHASPGPELDGPRRLPARTHVGSTIRSGARGSCSAARMRIPRSATCGSFRSRTMRDGAACRRSARAPPRVRPRARSSTRQATA